MFLIQCLIPFDDFTVEDKPYSVALHFRKNPVLADAAYTIMVETLKTHANWTLKSGKYVWEVVPKGVDKGSAILTLLKRMLTSGKIRKYCALRQWGLLVVMVRAARQEC